MAVPAGSKTNLQVLYALAWNQESENVVFSLLVVVEKGFGELLMEKRWIWQGLGQFCLFGPGRCLGCEWWMDSLPQ